MGGAVWVYWCGEEMTEMAEDKGHVPFALLSLGGDVGSGNGVESCLLSLLDVDAKTMLTPSRKCRRDDDYEGVGVRCVCV